MFEEKCVSCLHSAGDKLQSVERKWQNVKISRIFCVYREKLSISPTVFEKHQFWNIIQDRHQAILATNLDDVKAPPPPPPQQCHDLSCRGRKESDRVK